MARPFVPGALTTAVGRARIVLGAIVWRMRCVRRARISATRVGQFGLRDASLCVMLGFIFRTLRAVRAQRRSVRLVSCFRRATLPPMLRVSRALSLRILESCGMPVAHVPLRARWGSTRAVANVAGALSHNVGQARA